MGDYENTEVVLQKGGRVVRKVSIKKGKGYKSITKYKKGKKLFTIKKPIDKEHIKLIKKGKFIPGLFNDCKGCKTKKIRGGAETEEGDDLQPVPLDPESFKSFEEEISYIPIPPDEALKLFVSPTPQRK